MECEVRKNIRGEKTKQKFSGMNERAKIGWYKVLEEEWRHQIQF
jgi:hypothetical protein